MEEKSKKPKIRFKGFTEAWEQRKLGDIVYLRGRIGFRGYKRTDLVSEGDGAITFSPADIDDDGHLKLENNTYISFDKYEESPEIKVHEGDILFTKTASIGKIAYVPKLREKSTINPQFALLTPKNNIDNYFLFLSLRTEDCLTYAKNITGGSTIPTMSQEKLKEMDIILPDKEEQKKIGQYFKSIDNLITLHQRKYDKLVNIKKSLLEKMFSQNDSNVPKIRFKGFTEAWEQRKLSELSNVFDGTHQTPDYKDKGVMFLSVENIKTLQSEKYISKEDFIKNFKNYPEKNDILMTRIGDIGTPNIVKDNTPKAYYVSLALIKPTKINSSYLNIAIQSNFVQKGIKQRSLLTAIPMKINKDQIGQVEIQYPTDSKEQEKIGGLFKNIDNLITLHQRKLEKLKNIKKSLLEKMFI